MLVYQRVPPSDWDDVHHDPPLMVFFSVGWFGFGQHGQPDVSHLTINQF